MRRYWISPSDIHPDHVVIQDDPFHHIFGVCRQEHGSRFEILGDGRNAHLVEVTSLEKKKAIARIIESRVIPPLPKPHLVLALSIPRFPVMESIVEKAVEMGVHRIQPFFSEFSFVRKKASLPESKVERWNKIVVSATQQSGRSDLMPISSALDLEVVLQDFNRTPDRRGLFAYEGKSELGLRAYLESQRQSLPEEIWVFVGSEGGFSQTEVQEFGRHGMQTVTLGEQVLRVETACIALLAVLKYELGLMTRGPDDRS